MTNGGFAFPFPLPDDAQGQINELMSRADAVHDDTKNRFYGFLEKQSPEDLATLMALIGWGTDEMVGRLRLAHMMGWGEAIMRIKYPDVCNDCGRPECGKALGSLIKLHDPNDEQPPVASLFDPDLTPIEMQPGVVTPANREQLMELYGLVEAGDIFQCKNCAMPYQSVEDRMRRDPGVANCGGCREKTRWG